MVYASPTAFVREDSWTYLSNLSNCISVPWVLVGDFNQVLDDVDKREGLQSRSSKAQKLWDVWDTYGMIDLGFQGPIFTWTNSQSGRRKIMERLACVLGKCSLVFVI